MGNQAELASSIFTGLSSHYDSVVDWLTLYQDRSWKRRLLGKLALRKGLRVLDIGCGTGLLEERSSLGGSEVVGVDLTGTMIRRAAEKELASATVLGVADAEHLPFRDASFDVVISCYVPKYCDTKRLVGEVERVLKPGGRVAVYDFTRPKGLAAPVLELYVYALLPVLGRLLAPLDRSLAFTCAVLPGLIRTAKWDKEMGDALGSGGFAEEGEERMTAGIAALFWASKKQPH
jgi:demethylmenaquinone methyltransferase/2-methoxy-6-polyprenyl-1,4-benzoquinol methylase